MPTNIKIKTSMNEGKPQDILFACSMRKKCGKIVGFRKSNPSAFSFQSLR